MGKRYTKQEIDQIQSLIKEGLTSREIATRLERPESGIRNIRHRLKFKRETKESIDSLKLERRTLNKQVQNLRLELLSFKKRRDEISKALQIEEKILNQKLYNALQKMKDQKPELFHISGEEQLGKLIGELTGLFLKWLITE